jgi:hypothetical protein
MVFIKKPLDKRGKVIWKGKLKTCVIIESNGRCQKKGYQCAFTINMLYFLLIILEICYYERRHINVIRGLCCGNIL